MNYVVIFFFFFFSSHDCQNDCCSFELKNAVSNYPPVPVVFLLQIYSSIRPTPFELKNAVSKVPPSLLFFVFFFVKNFVKKFSFLFFHKGLFTALHYTSGFGLPGLTINSYLNNAIPYCTELQHGKIDKVFALY